MDFEKACKLIDKGIKMLPTGNIKMHDAEDVAAKMLSLLNSIALVKLNLEEKRSEYQSIMDIIYRDQVNKSAAKNVTEKKLDASADKDYIEVRESLEKTNARIDYLKANYRIFENAHIFFRQVSRGGDN